jgi:hypothetical protein
LKQSPILGLEFGTVKDNRRATNLDARYPKVFAPEAHRDFGYDGSPVESVHYL